MIPQESVIDMVNGTVSPVDFLSLPGTTKYFSTIGIFQWSAMGLLIH